MKLTSISIITDPEQGTTERAYLNPDLVAMIGRESSFTARVHLLSGNNFLIESKSLSRVAKLDIAGEPEPDSGWFAGEAILDKSYNMVYFNVYRIDGFIVGKIYVTILFGQLKIQLYLSDESKMALKALGEKLSIPRFSSAQSQDGQ